MHFWRSLWKYDEYFDNFYLFIQITENCFLELCFFSMVVENVAMLFLSFFPLILHLLRKAEFSEWIIQLSQFWCFQHCASASSSAEDENGLRHVMLCRVILGNMETVHAGSQQFHPCSKEYDSGVDDVSAPRRYIIWSAYMNSHILPSYIISFRAPLKGGNTNSKQLLLFRLNFELQSLDDFRFKF